MAGGMIGTALGYKRSALAGFARQTEEEQQKELANKQMAEAEKAQQIQMGVSAGMGVAMIIAACVM